MGSHWGHGTCCSTSVVFSNLNFENPLNIMLLPPEVRLILLVKAQ